MTKTKESGDQDLVLRLERIEQELEFVKRAVEKACHQDGGTHSDTCRSDCDSPPGKSATFEGEGPEGQCCRSSEDREEPEVQATISLLKDMLDRDVDAQDTGMGLLFAGLKRSDAGDSSWVSIHTSSQLDEARVPAEDIATLASVFTSPQRINIMLALMDGTLSALALSETTGLAGGQLYHHLKDLEAVGFVRKASRGDYQLTSEGLRQLLSMTLLVRQYRGSKIRDEVTNR